MSTEEIAQEIGKAYEEALDECASLPWQPWANKAARAIAERLETENQRLHEKIDELERLLDGIGEMMAGDDA